MTLSQFDYRARYRTGPGGQAGNGALQWIVFSSNIVSLRKCFERAADCTAPLANQALASRSVYFMFPFSRFVTLLSLSGPSPETHWIVLQEF